MKAATITGGAGLLGSSLAVAMRQALPDVKVTAADNLRRRGSEFTLQRVIDAGVAFVHRDIRSPEDLAGLPACDVLLECSA